jgi:serine/threonine protein kinase
MRYHGPRMASEDGDPAKGAPPPSSNDDAFAATVAPAPTIPAVPSKVMGSHSRESAARIESEQTVAAPLEGGLPPLPHVARALYTLDKEIARGGMGRIVAAEDVRLGRPVALKELLDPNSDHVTRFQREALITARLQHPGIVPVYEAGQWPGGEPFFAMKLVSGRPLDRVIGDAKKLEDRLALLPRLAAACDAIAYAHSQRIVHRDLKPGNVLIGDFGETVVIDWGLAKDLDTVESPESANRSPRAQVVKPEAGSQSSTLTVAGAVMGTPAYMPPEQARGEQVDTRADVFALGAMLYHLLAGVPPYAARTATDVIAAAVLGKVVPLGQRERRAPPDLVAIVERAMAPEVADRYQNAGELAEELRRFLTGRLVGAHRYTALQRIGRFVRKHRAAVTIATVAVIGFAVGGTMAITRIVRARDLARAEEQIATTRKIAAERLIDFTLTRMKTQLKAIGRLDLLADLGVEVRRYFDKLQKIPGGMPPEDELRMVEAIELIGQAEHTSGKPDAALATWRDARTKIAEIVRNDGGPRTFRLRRLLAQLDTESGEILQERGQLADAIQQYNAAKQEWDDLQREQPRERELLLGAADTHDKLGDVLRTEGKIDQAFDEYSEARAERERATSQGGGQVTEELMALSTSHLKLGSVYQLRGESSLALDEYRAALKLREQLLTAQPDNVIVQQRVLDVQDSLADLERSVGDDTAAIETYRAALPATALLVRRDPTNADWQRQRGNMLADLGFALMATGKFAEGKDQLEQAIALQRDLAARDPKSTRYKVDLSRSFTRAGDALIDLGKPDDGIAEYKRALDMRKELVDKDASSVPFRRSYAWSFAKLAGAYSLRGDLEHALDAHEQALKIRDDLVAQAPAQGGFRNELALTEVELGKLLASKDAKRSLELIGQGLGRARTLVDNDPINNEWKDTLVQGLLAQAAGATDPKARAAALDEARDVASAAHQHAPANVHLAARLAEVEAALADVAIARGDARAASAAWATVRDVLEPLAREGRLPAPRQTLLDRARVRR